MNSKPKHLPVAERCLTIFLACTALAGCNLAPAYHRPATSLPASFKEAPGWTSAAPADDVAKGEWWLLLDDPTLSALEARVSVNNQNVAAAAAAYAQARAQGKAARAALFPTVDLSANATRAGSFGNNTPAIIGTTGATTGGSGTGSGIGTGSGTTTGTTTGTAVSRNSGSRRYEVTVGASWEPDLWGRLANGVRQQQALAFAA